MDHPITADSTPAQTPTLTRRRPVADPNVDRYVALTADQREAIDAFLAENRPWALRQARRAYRHLPDSLREQAVDRACLELRTRAPRSLERRALSAELAGRLTESLRHVHVGWCLNESSALLRREGTEPVQPEVRREDLADFVDKGLGGLERAVLQLEIGAGRDTRTARAALRLGPRQYAAHREAGLSKLRDAIGAQIIGRACDQHVSSVVAAATGDRNAMDGLTAGPQRCRFCAREAQGLRSVLHERLAVAPWPIAIAPASALAAKLGAIGSAFGAKGAGVGALGAGGSGASAAATVLAAAALATGTAALVDGDRSPNKLRSKDSAPAAAVTKSDKGGKHNGGSSKPKSARADRKAEPKRSSGGARNGQARVQGTGAAPAAESPAVVAATGAAPAAPAAAQAPETSGPVTSTTKPLTDTVDQTVDQVTNVAPGPVGDTVDGTVDGVTDTVDDVTGVVDGLLPKP